MVIWISALAATIKPSLTRVATAIAENVRPTLAAREKELLKVPYVHVVFTLPHQLSHLALSNKKVVYDLLLRTSAATLLEIAADPKHLGAEIGFMSVLHTWGQNVLHHPHAHCVIPAGGLSLDHQH